MNLDKKDQRKQLKKEIGVTADQPLMKMSTFMVLICATSFKKNMAFWKKNVWLVEYLIGVSRSVKSVPHGLS